MHDARPPWKTLYERDLDLVLLDLLHSSAAFRTRLLHAVAPDVAADPAAGFVGAWHSVTDATGESDLEAVWRIDGGRFVLLIEDKLDARCQPEQALRYRRRADAYVATGAAAVARTLLVAPEGYAERHREDTAPFEAHLAIGTVADWCDAAGVAGERGAYVARFLRHAVGRTARLAAPAPARPAAAGPIGGGDGAPRPGGKPLFPHAYAAVRVELGAGFPALAISNPKASEWVLFAFDGRDPYVGLRYRLRDHWAELVLPRASVAEAALGGAHAADPLPGARVTPRGATELALWAPTPELDLAADVGEQRDRVRAALATVDALRLWYLRHRTSLLDTASVPPT